MRFDPTFANWWDYDDFDLVDEMPVLPNFFFAFAPSVATWHGASTTARSFAAVRDKDSRSTLLGFVSGRRSRLWSQTFKADEFNHEPGVPGKLAYRQYYV